MSTKVYNGIKFKSKEFHIVLEQLKSLRPKAKEIALNILKENQLRVFIAMKELVDADPYDIIKQMEISSNKNFRDHEDININFHVCVFPHKNGNIYGYYFSDIRQYEDLIMDDEICDDYHYQDNTDMSNYNWNEKWEDMSKERQDALEKDWKEREQIWEDLMGFGTFRENSFMFDIVDGHYDINEFRLYSTIKDIQNKLRLQITRKNKLENLGS